MTMTRFLTKWRAGKMVYVKTLSGKPQIQLWKDKETGYLYEVTFVEVV